MASDTGFGEVRFFDDFLTDAYSTFNWTVTANDGGDTADVVEEENGVMVFNNDGDNGDIINMFGAEIWQPNVQGTVIFEARVKMKTSITQDLFIGLSDENDADVMPADWDTGTITLTAVNCVGFLYGSEKGSNWYAVSQKASSAGAQTSCEVGPTLGTYQTFRITVQSNGDCRYFIDGKEITVSGVARTAAVTTSSQYCAAIAQLASGTAADAHIDYVMVKAGRA